MKRAGLLFGLLAWTLWSRADDGRLLWLGGTAPDSPCRVKVRGIGPTAPHATETTVALAREALADGYRGSDVTLVLDTAARLGDGFRLQGPRPATVTASSAVGLLYGAYALLRRQNTQAETGPYDCMERPALTLRMLDHWDNPDGSVERGYAGRSIWKWEQMAAGRMSDSLRARLCLYAQANASVGINAVVLNNVNASPKMLSRIYLDKVQVVADLLRPYGIRVYLSVNFASPMALGDTRTADPQNARVRRWWQRKAAEIYALMPDFGGFLVKANSEGQPGPGDYHRTHAEGANMLADALAPYGGKVVWRSFVYGAGHRHEDRVKQAVSEFAGLDGLFRDNVMLQSKNGPLDFQPREPYAPIFDRMERTSQLAELQITQEYLGQSRHLVYLAPMWKEFFEQVKPSRLKGVAGVANVGDTANWCGHPFSQANWYAFGRLAWNPELSAEAIADEWLRQTFHTADARFLAPVGMMMMTSREACVNYMMPLGLHHLFKFDHHYGPEPGGFKASYPREWCPVYYHRADSAGIGFDRTVATGSGATAQYREPYATQYERLETCPEQLLLWFHHVPWDYRMQSGNTLWQELCCKYRLGVSMVEVYRDFWRSSTRPYVDAERWQQVDGLLQVQQNDAREWRETCLDYFQTFSHQPIE